MGRHDGLSAARAERIRRRIRRPPAHWSLLAFFLLALAALLVVQGLAFQSVGATRTPGPTSTAALPKGASSVLVAQGGRLTPRPGSPGRRIALTFDDGPDPRWTPAIARTLRRLRVPATFFVVGSQVVRHPGVVDDLHRQGFELANHTFTHADPAALPDWQRSLQLGMTQTVMAGAAGVRARLMRPPYSSTPAALGAAQAEALDEVAGEGYVIALSDFDGRDWDGSNAATIVRRATPPTRRGGMILLHDGGGDRADTLAALPRLVARLRARGFRFVRASELAGLSRAAAEPRATGWDRLRGRLLLGTLRVARWVTGAITFLLAPIALLMIARALSVLFLAHRHRRDRRRAEVPDDFTPPVSILVPAYNEAVGIERAVRSLAASDYPELEVVVIDDGSTDGTAELVEGLGLSGVRVLRQANAGKAAALNRGVAAARHDVLVMVDGDTLFEPETLRRVVRPLRDAGVGAVSGNTKVGNRHGLLGRWQHIEYVMGFNLDRRLYDVLQCMPTVPGAIGAFRREALTAAGGLSTATLAEDTDLTIAIGRAGWRVVYAQDALAWTEAPASLSALWRQRYRWSYGTLQAVWKHRSALWHRGEGRVGRRGLPYLVLFQIALPMLAPLIDVFALYGLVFLDPVPVLVYWLGFNGLQLGLAIYAFRLDGERLGPLWTMPLQQLVYRQLMYLVVLESALSAMRGTRLRWQHMERTGDVEVVR